MDFLVGGNKFWSGKVLVEENEEDGKQYCEVEGLKEPVHQQSKRNALPEEESEGDNQQLWNSCEKQAKFRVAQREENLLCHPKIEENKETAYTGSEHCL